MLKTFVGWLSGGGFSRTRDAWSKGVPKNMQSEARKAHQRSFWFGMPVARRVIVMDGSTRNVAASRQEITGTTISNSGPVTALGLPGIEMNVIAAGAFECPEIAGGEQDAEAVMARQMADATCWCRMVDRVGSWAML